MRTLPRPTTFALSIEHIPWYAIPDIDTAWEIVQESGATNGGICVDLMHWQRQRGGPDFDRLRHIPGEHINYVQLTDDTGRPVSSAEEYMVECLTVRPVPGRRHHRPGRHARHAGRAGGDPYVAYQVCNTEMASAGASAMAARLLAPMPSTPRLKRSARVALRVRTGGQSSVDDVTPEPQGGWVSNISCTCEGAPPVQTRYRLLTMPASTGNNLRR